ncbi:mannitol dehydrogenase family protein [uncultured Paraglaciecola sp.]|uniref:mannitol dehydrogenase family protein n=1 Tax=uncultured Paraglaciecola sp. TaxID=1765024 RepID=UPI0030D88714|tara:strand:- start:72354 stop:73838 length:1485 start_codon:yes stop_codon:yes gene_type:complete
MQDSPRQLNQIFLQSEDCVNNSTDVIYPSYKRDEVNIGIVHLGLGAFHRSHQAMYTEQLLNLQGGGDWGICAVSFRNQALQAQLNKQDCLYTTAILDVEDSFQVVGAIKEVLVVKTQASLVLERMAAETTKIVSLTVTEKGYCLNAQGVLDETLPEIINDLASIEQPGSAIGLIVAALNLRFKKGIKPFHVIACDNLPENGRKLKSAVIQFASKISENLAQWIDKEIHFPNTMVDSITPKTEQDTVDLIKNKLGLIDEAPVQREMFAQWVIEACPNMERPEWEKVGVIFTPDVESFENAKLRILNGLHSALAYIGLLSGYDTVYQAISDEKIKSFLVALVDNEIIPTIDAPTGLNLQDYSRAILARFENPKIKHLLSQIACDGSIKIPVRTLAPIQNNIGADRSIQSLSMVVAAWIHFIRVSYVKKQAVHDPRATELLTAVSQFQGNSNEDVSNFLEIDGLLPDSLKNNVSFITPIQKAYAEIASTFKESPFNA